MEKYVIPEAGFEVALELGQIEIRACAARQQFLRVVPEEEPEIKQRSRHRLPVDDDVLLRQMPAARPNKQDGCRGGQFVGFTCRRIRISDRAPVSVPQVYITLHE